MAENGPVTPEKQLLKLIEEAKGKEALKKASSEHKRRPFVSLGFLKGTFFGRLSFFKRRAKKGIATRRELSISLAAVNRALTAGVVILFVYVVWDTAHSAMNLRKPPDFALQAERSAQTPPAEAASLLREPGYYLRKVAARDIFGVRGRQQQLRKKEEKEALPEVIVEQVDSEKPIKLDLALVGISWSANPDAIIEDKASRRTYFVQAGQTIAGGVRVEAIFQHKVVLSYEGREFEIR